MTLGNYCRLVAMLAVAAINLAFLQELIGSTMGWSREFNNCYFVIFFYKLTIITGWFDIKRFSYLLITLRLVKRPVEFKREIFYWWMYTSRALDKERHLSDSSNYVFAGAQLLNRQLPISVCLFSWRYNPMCLYFHSLVAGFSLLVFEVS